MAETVVCPSCRSAVEVPVGHAAATIHCGICWTEVPVPARPTPPPAAPAPPASGVTRPPAKSGVRVAAALPAGGRPATGMAPLEAIIHKAAAKLAPPPAAVKSAPVVALPAAPSVPVFATLVAPPPSAPPPRRDEPPVRSRTRFRRDDEDDDEDDLPPRRLRTSGSAGLVAAVAGGAVALLVLVVGVFYMLNRVSDPAADPPPANADAGPKAGGNPLPQFRPPVPDPGAFAPRFAPPDPDPAAWEDVREADGFEAKMPPNQFVFRTWQENIHDQANFLTVARGRKYQGTGPTGDRFDITFVDCPPGSRPDVRKMCEPPGRRSPVVAAKVGGRDGFECRRDDARGEVRRAVQVGPRVYVLTASPGGPPADWAAARDKFFDSFRPLDDGRGAVADPPAGEPKLAARIDPFLSAVVFPARGEVFTIGLRPGSRTQGVLRRYTYPGFVPRNTYHLPAAGTFAVGSDKTNRLAITTVGRAAESPTGKEADRPVVAGDVHVFDLAPVFRGAVEERAELKPLAEVPFAGARLAGLEVTPDGKTAIALSIAAAKAKGGWRAKLTRIDLYAGTAAGDLELPGVAWRTRLSADGAKLYAAEVQVTPQGGWALGVSRVENVLTIDVPGWRKDRTLTTPGPTYDLAASPSGVLLASVLQGDRVRAFAVPADGAAIDLNPDESHTAALGHVALTADGKTLVTSAIRGEGLDVYAVANLAGPDGLTKVASATRVRATPADPGVPVGGAFLLTPDGKFAVLHVGAVIDLSR